MISAKFVGFVLALVMAVYADRKWVRPWYNRLSEKVQSMILVVLAVNGSMVMWWLVSLSVKK
jgi:hypothetical protein